VKENTATNWFLYRKAEHLTGEQMHDEYAERPTNSEDSRDAGRIKGGQVKL